MMVLKIFFTPDEIAQFFEANGFSTVTLKKGKFEKQYHNREEWVEYETTGVHIDGRTIEAESLFEKVVEQRIKRMIAPENLEMKRTIENTFKNLLK